MIRISVFLLVCTLTCLVSGVVAQKAPLRGDDPRLVQLHDLGDFVAGAKVTSKKGSTDAVRKQLERIAGFIRTFVEPALAADEDIQPLGTQYLAMLARPEHQAWLERLLQQWKIDRYKVGISIQILVDRSPEFINRHFGTWLKGASLSESVSHVLSDPAKITGLRRSLMRDPESESMTAPELEVLPLREAQLSIGQQLAYIKDYEIKRQADGSKKAIAIPGHLFDGLEVTAIAAVVAENDIVLDFELCARSVEKPIRQFSTELEPGGKKYRIDLPEWRVLKLEQKLRMQDGGMAIVRAPLANGKFAVALVRVEVKL